MLPIKRIFAWRGANKSCPGLSLGVAKATEKTWTTPVSYAADSEGY